MEGIYYIRLLHVASCLMRLASRLDAPCQVSVRFNSLVQVVVRSVKALKQSYDTHTYLEADADGAAACTWFDSIRIELWRQD